MAALISRSQRGRLPSRRGPETLGMLAALATTLVAGRIHAEPWSEGRPRWFVSTKSDVGFAYLRPRVATGYGQPHYFWGGAEANPILSSTSTGGYAGLGFDH
jgi:hypothetical protein